MTAKHRTYTQALATARKSGAWAADDAGRMALICEDTIPILVGAVSPQLVWEGAQRAGLTTKELLNLAHKDFVAIDALQWS